MRRRLQNRIAESSATLPTVCVVATLLWWLPTGGYTTPLLLGWLACAVTTAFLLETDAQNALLRVRSRMIPSLFLLLMAACGFLHPLQDGTVVQLLLAASLLCLLRTSEHPRPQADTFHAHLLLSLSSLLWSPMLLLAPVLWWCQGVYLRSLGWRGLGAAVCGLVLPWAFWAGGAFALGQMQPFVDHAVDIIAPARVPFYWMWFIEQARQLTWADFWNTVPAELGSRLAAHVPEVATLAVTLLIGLTGFIHYVRRSYDDKIRVRMCHYTFMALQFVMALWLVLQPQFFGQLMPLLLVTVAPAAAHFMALTRTWVTNAWVVFLALALLAAAVVALTPDAVLLMAFK